MSRANLLFSLYVLGGYNGSPIEFVESEDRLKPLAKNVIGFTPRAEALEDLERVGSVTLRRDGDRVIVTSLTVPEHLKIAFQEHPFFWRQCECQCSTSFCSPASE
jgi:hypothetical protein